jgi:hypothetical protein
MYRELVLGTVPIGACIVLIQVRVRINSWVALNADFDLVTRLYVEATGAAS